MGGIVTFGKKHFGKTLTQVVLHDPDWFFWAIDNDVFDRHPGLLSEANDLAYKARNIKIPRPNPQDWRIEYIVTCDGKFADFRIVEASSTPEDGGWDDVFRADRLDLSIPRQLRQYDKKGCGLLLKKFKRYFSDGRAVRLTKEWCDEFFANPNNFVYRGEGSPLSADCSVRRFSSQTFPNPPSRSPVTSYVCRSTCTNLGWLSGTAGDDMTGAGFQTIPLTQISRIELVRKGN